MRIFKKKAPVIVLDEGPLSGKIVVVGTMGKTCRFGALKICKYADGELHEYGAPLEVKDVGEPLVTVVFGSKEGVKRLSDSLYALYRKMEDASEPPKEVE